MLARSTQQECPHRSSARLFLGQKNRILQCAATLKRSVNSGCLSLIALSKAAVLLVENPAKTIDEPRFLVVGKIGEKHWSGIITYRNENIRIISRRGARDEEIELYES